MLWLFGCVLILGFCLDGFLRGRLRNTKMAAPLPSRAGFGKTGRVNIAEHCLKGGVGDPRAFLILAIKRVRFRS